MKNLELTSSEVSLKLVRHDTPESILAEHWGYPWEELKEGTMAAFDEEGNEEDYSFESIIEGMYLQKFWGFANKEKSEIHVWVMSDADEQEVAFFLGS